MSVRNLCCGGVAALVVLAGFGCHKASSQPRKPVVKFAVKILRDGKPLEGAVVTLWPKDAAMRNSTGRTGPDGIADLMTYEAGDGAPPGEYDVTVEKITNANPITGIAASNDPKAREKYLQLGRSSHSELPRS